MKAKEIIKKLGIGKGQSREGATPKGVIHYVIASERDYGHLVAHGQSSEGNTPDKLNAMLGAEKVASLAARQRVTTL